MTEKRILLKICGMRDEENIRTIAALNPDYMGFIFYEKSPRYVGVDFKLPHDFPEGIKPVGVFVNAANEEIFKVAARNGIHVLQLHGHESPQQVKELKERGFAILKVFSIDDEFDFSLLEPYEPFVEYFLFDTKGKYFGGNAQRFNWSVLKKYNQRIPFFLSGGIDLENISEVGRLENLNLHGVDVNSGVEIQPALKDPMKVKAISDYIKSMDELKQRSSI